VQTLEKTARRTPKIDQRYSGILLGLGVFLIAGALTTGTVVQGDGKELAAAYGFVSENLLFIGASSLAAVLIRWLRLPIYLPVTTAVSILLAVGFPIGTFAFWYWFTKVMPHELEFESEAERRSFRYTAGLYTASLTLCLPLLVFRFLSSTSPPADQAIWQMFSLGFLAAALLLLLVGVLRSFKLRLSYYATLLLNVLLVLYFPVGTCFALVWFLAVKKHDRLIYGLA
jgi:hypothetical protein